MYRFQVCRIATCIVALVQSIINANILHSSEAGSSVDSWAYYWFCSMSNAVHDKTLNNMLQACKLAFKRDIKTLTFCLPYIVCEY